MAVFLLADLEQSIPSSVSVLELSSKPTDSESSKGRCLGYIASSILLLLADADKQAVIVDDSLGHITSHPAVATLTDAGKQTMTALPFPLLLCAHVCMRCVHVSGW